MKKKIWVSVLAIIVLAVAMIGSGAFYSDAEITPPNAFAAAKIDLEFGASTLPFDVVGALPGQSGIGKVTLTNAAGSVPAMLNISLVNVVDNENDLIEPEIHPGYGTADYDGNGGELDFFLFFAAFVDVNQDGAFNGGDIQLAYGGQKQAFPGFWGGNFHYSGLTSMLPAWNNVITLAGGQSVDLVVMWQFPTESTDPNYSQNISMTDSLGFDVQFVLNQIP